MSGLGKRDLSKNKVKFHKITHSSMIKGEAPQFSKMSMDKPKENLHKLE